MSKSSGRSVLALDDDDVRGVLIIGNKVGARGTYVPVCCVKCKSERVR